MVRESAPPSFINSFGLKVGAIARCSSATEIAYEKRTVYNQILTYIYIDNG